MMEFCTLCKREVKDWRTHIHSEQHKRNSYELIKNKAAAK